MPYCVLSTTFIIKYLLCELAVLPTLHWRSQQDLRHPQSRTELQSFLGFVNFLAPFIRCLATTAEPLRDLIRGQKRFCWLKVHEDSFNKVKEAITCSSTLAFFDSSKQTELIVDASPFGLGAILCQSNKQQSRMPVQFASRSLSDCERRYSQLEREALAIKWACERFKLYLVGDPSFIVVTDHKPLLDIYRAGSRPTPRLERWALQLQAFKFVLKYEPGAANAADLLSRQPIACQNPSRTNPSSVRYCNSLIIDAIPKMLTIEEIAEGTKADPTLSTAASSLMSGNWDKTHPLFTVRSDLCHQNGIILKDKRIVPPRALVQRLLETAHTGHMSAGKMKSRLRRKLWWHTMDKDVEGFASMCTPCALTGRKPLPPTLVPGSLPDLPWSTLGIDHIGPLPSGEYILVVIDHHSRYAEVEVVSSPNSESTIRTLIKLFSRHGKPDKIISDNGTAFTSTLFASTLKKLGIQHHLVSPYWPQGNGLTERFNRNIKKVLQCAHLEGTDWQVALDLYIAQYIATEHPGTSETPIQLMLKRDFRCFLPSLSSLQAVSTELQNRHSQYKSSMSGNYNRTHLNRNANHFQIGDKVLCINVHARGKLTPRFLTEVFTVSSIEGGKIRISARDGREYFRHYSHLKKTHPGMQRLSVRQPGDWMPDHPSQPINIESNEPGTHLSTEPPPASPPRSSTRRCGPPAFYGDPRFH